MIGSIEYYSKITEFSVEIPLVGVIFSKLQNVEFTDNIIDLNSAKYTYDWYTYTVNNPNSTYRHQVYLAGDFSISMNLAEKYKGNPPSYWLTGRNCAWLALEVLQQSTTGKVYDRIESKLWYYVENPLDKCKVRSLLIPNTLHGEIKNLFKGK